MGKTYSCPFEDCGMVFSRAFQLKKHKVTHDHSASLFYCTGCDFYTLSSRNLEVHMARHTGEKGLQCPDTVTPSGSLAEERCSYKTNDPSSLTKHRKKAHGHVPRPGASPQRGTTYTLVPYPVGPNERISLDTQGQSANVGASGSSSTTSVTEAHNPVPNLQGNAFATGIFGMNTGQDGPGIEGWNESDWNNFLARFNSV